MIAKITGLEKRKACDSCHVKRIRCDARKPQCSHCIMYDKQCIYTPFISKKRDKSSRSNAKRNAVVSHHKELDSSTNKRLSPVINPSSSRYPLPSLAEILPLVDDYFSNFNTIIPLFTENSFRLSIIKWDEDRSGGDPLVEASLNIVLALSLQYRATKRIASGIEGVESLMSNAQLPIGTLMSRIQDLRGLQILLGLALLFQRAPDPQPALIFIATAVQLAHRLRIHEDPSIWNLPSEIASERNSLFWITYILDKDINVRSSVPYMHQDHDISATPPLTFDDKNNTIMIGMIKDLEHRPIFNLMAARVHLARILGRVYDWMLSSSYREQPRYDKNPQRDRLRTVLRGWEEAMPRIFFHPEGLLESLSECARRQALILYFDYVYVLFKTYGVFVHDAEWIRLLSNYGDKRESGCGEATEGIMTESWPEILAVSRKVMSLHKYIDSDDGALIWSVSCTYISAMIILITNKLFMSEMERMGQLQNDTRLVEEALRLLERIAEGSVGPQVRALHTACVELDRHAQMVLRERSRTAANEMTGFTKMTDEGIETRKVVANLQQAFMEARLKPLAPMSL